MTKAVFVMGAAVASGSAFAGWLPRVTSIPTLGEVAMVGLAVAVGVVGGKMLQKRRK